MKQKLQYVFYLLLAVQFSACSKKEKKQADNTAMNTIEKKATSINIDAKLFENQLLTLKVDSTQTTYKHRDSILAFYKLRNNKPAWNLLENRKQLFEAIKNSYQEGLLPKDYQFSKLEHLQNQDALDNRNNIALDLLHTDIYLSYAYHLANGKVDYKTLYDDWNLPKNQFEYNQILNKGINNHAVLISLNTFKPTQPIYNQLKSVLTKQKELINLDSLKTQIQNGNKIRPNKSDKRIINIRKRLVELGYHQNDTTTANSIVLDSILQKDIKAFQQGKNLAMDAIVGKGTITELNKSNREKYNSIIANLERWRWYPRNFGDDFVLVNIPDYTLRYFTAKDTTNYNVIVGKTKRKTPVFNADVAYLVFNPKWHIPPTIKNEDIIPAAQKKPSSITRKRITIYNREGKVMHPDSIQWGSPETSKYHYVQSAGRNNALGLVKIIFPNPYSVFLHDTNSRSLFKKNFRSRSSGCVRVENPFKLVGEILKWKTNQVDSLVNKKHTKRIYLKHKTSVYMLYWNIVFDNNKTPQFLHDVYDFDTELSHKLLQ